MTREARILLAVDDLASSALVGGALEANHRVRACAGARPVPGLVAAFRPDVVVMDLPADPSVISAVVRRTHASYRPMLLCTLDDGATQRLPALAAGADACMDKPFTAEAVEIHVRALLRRAPWLTRTVHQVGTLVVDEDAHVALVDDVPVALSAKEFGLLAMLASHSGTVLSKRTLLEHLWGFSAYDENLVEVHMCALRRRLPPSGARLIRTVRGVGYVLRDEIAPQGRLA